MSTGEAAALHCQGWYAQSGGDLHQLEGMFWIPGGECWLLTENWLHMDTPPPPTPRLSWKGCLVCADRSKTSGKNWGGGWHLRVCEWLLVQKLQSVSFLKILLSPERIWEYCHEFFLWTPSLCYCNLNCLSQYSSSMWSVVLEIIGCQTNGFAI